MKRIIGIGVSILCCIVAVAQDSLSIKKPDSIPPATYYYRKPSNQKKFLFDLSPGINLFLVTARGTAVDLNPYVTKQVSSRWAFGLGWNQRISFRRGRGGGSNYISQLYGPRLSIKYSLSHGFSARVLSDFVHIRWPRNLYPPDHPRYSWEWSMFTGIQKEFKISRRIIGYAEILYDIASSSDLPLYGDKVNLRFGIEFKKSNRKR